MSGDDLADGRVYMTPPSAKCVCGHELGEHQSGPKDTKRPCARSRCSCPGFAEEPPEDATLLSLAEKIYSENLGYEGKAVVRRIASTIHWFLGHREQPWLYRRPTVAGWWWWQRDPGSPPEIVELFCRKDGSWLWRVSGGRLHDQPTGRWSGTIALPNGYEPWSLG